MIHQDASTHEWVLGKKWDCGPMDDAGEIYSAFFVAQGDMEQFSGRTGCIEE